MIGFCYVRRSNENSDNVWIENILCVPSIPKTTFMVRTSASDPGFRGEHGICHGNNLAFMYTREFAHFYPRSRPLFHARFDAGSAIFLPPSMVRSRNHTNHNIIPYIHDFLSKLFVSFNCEAYFSS